LQPASTYALSTPAEFKCGEGTPPPTASGSRLPLRHTGNDVIDPVLITLPQSCDKDLTDPATIAEAQGYTQAVKTAGSRRKVKATKGKGKENENLAYANPKKRLRGDRDDDEDAMPARRGRPHGSNNYSSLDVCTLLKMVEDELPLGQCGWQAIYLKFSEWAKTNNRPERKVTSLETKFKQVTYDSNSIVAMRLLTSLTVGKDYKTNGQWCVPS
jgi:hypothetical protein